MGKTKENVFTAAQNRMANLAKALGHPARIAILQHLINKERCVCGDIVEEIPLSQSTISQHLKALKEAGVIHGDIEGVTVCYCINPKVWGELKTILNNFLSSYKNCC
ncbi:MAG: metalloregulator ArsR/SmtB family transcription factor [Bacteroidota bacterium]